jgi:hypothetical protein
VCEQKPFQPCQIGPTFDFKPEKALVLLQETGSVAVTDWFIMQDLLIC